MKKIPTAQQSRPIGAAAASVLQRNSSMLASALQNAAGSPNSGNNNSGGQQSGLLTVNSNNMTMMNKRYNLTIHGEDFSKSEVIINPTIFPNISVGDVIEIVQQRDMAISSGNNIGSTGVNVNSSSGSSANNNSKGVSSSGAHAAMQKRSTVNLIVKVKERAVKGIQHLSVLKSIADAMGLVQRKEATVCLSATNPKSESFNFHDLTLLRFFFQYYYNFTKDTPGEC